ncbi:MAG: TAXI family TRAP transporter solute-binding subunit [Firmicutes bacterium]|nr:TAXI family TRAP transporter solute-binding subunit [Bacillota bacterium]
MSLVLVCTSVNFAAPRRFMSLATASLGGTYYIIGSAIADVITKNVPGVEVSAIVSQGSVGNPTLVDSGEADLAITNFYSGSVAYSGGQPYGKKMNIRGIMPLQYSILHLVTFEARKDINTIADLRGKRIAVGPAGGGGVLLFRTLLSFYGMSIDDVKPSYMSYADGTSAIKDGNVDVTMPHGAPPIEAINELASRDKIKFVTISDDVLEMLHAKYPYYERAVIPAGTYKGVDRDVVSVGVRDMLVVNSKVDDDTVYKITKAIYEHLDEVRKVHPSAKTIRFEGYNNELVPLHPGALKFYKENGIKIEE